MIVLVTAVQFFCVQVVSLFSVILFTLSASDVLLIKTALRINCRVVDCRGVFTLVKPPTPRPALRMRFVPSVEQRLVIPVKKEVYLPHP